MRRLIGILFYTLPLLSFSQIQFTWKELWNVPVNLQSIATIDQYNNLYYTNQQVLYKVDSLGKQRFSQSIKSWSAISYIDTRNPMKLMLFSEGQQVIEYLDNTLTKQQDYIDLNDEGFSFATRAISSSQPDKIWVFDSDNSRLVLFSKNQSQRQQIDNIYGLLNAKEITQMLEYNNQLYLLDNTKGLFILDRYGTLVNFTEIIGAQYMLIENDILYYLKDHELYFYNLRLKDGDKINIPLENVLRFYKNGNRFYFQTANQIQVYQINTAE